MKKIFNLLLILLIISLSSCSHEQTEDIVILYTNDVASVVNDENIGMAGVKAYKDIMKSQYRYVSLVDAGDYYDGELSKRDGGIHITELMNLAEYDVVNLGNQEFSIGLDNLVNNIKHSNFDTVTCNIKYIGKGRDPLRKVKPYVIKNYGGTKVAFIGVITPDTLIPGKPAFAAITDDNGNLLYYFYEGDEGQNLYEQVQKTVDKIRNRVDYVIVLAHLGSNSTQEGFSSVDLIENTTGIDVVIDGHSHTEISGELLYNKEGTGVGLTSTGKELENLGVLILHPDHTYNTVLYPTVDEKDPAIVMKIAEIYGE